MGLKESWSKTIGWLQDRGLTKDNDCHPELTDEGLISQESISSKIEAESSKPQNNPVTVKPVLSQDKNQSLEKLQEGFGKLIEQLQNINTNLDRQVTQNEDLMSHMSKLPELLESFPAVVENQKKLTEQMLEQLKAGSVKEQQFIEAVEQIPAETSKQTDALANIDHQLAAAADADVQMAESFNKFNETLEKFDQTTIGQTDGIMQMSKTFATSDRYLKYLMSRQNKRFMWIFMTAMGVCVLTILILTGIVVYLKQ